MKADLQSSVGDARVGGVSNPTSRRKQRARAIARGHDQVSAAFIPQSRARGIRNLSDCPKWGDRQDDSPFLTP